MTNAQLYLALGVPLFVNGLLFTILAITTTSRMTALEARMTSLETTMTARFDLLMGKFVELDNRLGRLEERFEARWGK